MEYCFSTFQLFKRQFIVIVVLLTLPKLGLAWGLRGHALVCEAAIHLVKDESLKRFLVSKTEAITYLCNLPDTHWRSVEGAESGGPTHYFEADLIGSSFEKFPASSTYSTIEHMAIGKVNLNKKKPVLSVARELGSSWWRADQLVRLAIASGKKANQKSQLEKDDNDLFESWVMMGLLGHFIADNAQPFHNTKNYDGWDNGHGGIHSYYESDLVNELTYEALTEIIQAAPKAQRELGLEHSQTIIERMKNLSIISYKEIPKLLEKDSVQKPSTIKNEKGMELKHEAERKPAKSVLPNFKPMLIAHMARGAALLAATWEQIYVVSGKPSFAKNASNRFPHQFRFIPPDYTTEFKK